MGYRVAEWIIENNLGRISLLISISVLVGYIIYKIRKGGDKKK